MASRRIYFIFLVALTFIEIHSFSRIGEHSRHVRSKHGGHQGTNPLEMGKKGNPRKMWKPDGGMTKEEWMRCRGNPCDKWERMQRKMFDLQRKVSSSGSTYNNSMLMHDGPTYETVDNCIMLTEDQLDYLLINMEKEGNQNEAGGHRRWARNTAFRSGMVEEWENQLVYWKFDGEHSPSEQDHIRSAFHHWEEQTCVRFTELQTDLPFKENHILITKQSGGCYSYVGRVSLIPQQLNLQAACLYNFGTSVHEIGHALGFFHEQQRSDRDQYIEVLWDNLSAYAAQFLLRETDDLVPYDYSSVMHYGPKSGGLNNQLTMRALDPHYQQTMGQRQGLSFLDAKLINLIYCNETCPSPLPQPCQYGGYQDPNDCSRCRCPYGLAGRYCDTVAPPVHADCGGTYDLDINSPPLYIKSPGYDKPGYYNDYQQCYWWIKVPHGSRVKLEFEPTGFGLYCGYQGECAHWVEVRYKANIGELGPRFCCYLKPDAVITSEENQMLVVFQANSSALLQSRRRGFRARVWASNDHIVKPTTTTTTTTAKPTTTPTTTTTTPVPKTLPPVIETKECPDLDVVFLIDTATTKDNFDNHRKFMSALVQSLGSSVPDIKVGLITFASTAKTQFGLSYHPNLADTVMAINEMTFSVQDGSTSYYEGLHLARGEFLYNKRPHATQVIIMITDSRDTNIWRGIVEANAARVERAMLFVVGVGPAFSVKDGLWLTGDKERVYQLTSFKELPDNEVLHSIRNSICPFDDRWQCSFEDEADPFCGMTQGTSDQFEWTRHSGTTPSAVTGPLKAQDGQFYAYIEVTNRQPGDTAELYAPRLSTTGFHCVMFHYNMYGFHVRRLALIQRTLDTSDVETVWERIGEIGVDWNKADVDVYLEEGQVVGFVGTRGDEYSGDIAIDNISIVSGRCEM